MRVLRGIWGCLGKGALIIVSVFFLGLLIALLIGSLGMVLYLLYLESLETMREDPTGAAIVIGIICLGMLIAAFYLLFGMIKDSLREAERRRRRERDRLDEISKAQARREQEMAQEITALKDKVIRLRKELDERQGD